MAKSALYPWLPVHLINKSQVDKATKLLDLMAEFATACEENEVARNPETVARYKATHFAVFTYAMDLTTYDGAKAGIA